MPYIFNPTTGKYEPITRDEAENVYGYGQDPDSARDLYDKMYSDTGQLENPIVGNQQVVSDPYTPESLPSYPVMIQKPGEDNYTTYTHPDPKVTIDNDSGTIVQDDEIKDDPIINTSGINFDNFDASGLIDALSLGIPPLGIFNFFKGLTGDSVPDQDTTTAEKIGFNLGNITDIFTNPIILLMLFSGQGSFKDMLPMILIMSMMNKNNGGQLF